MSNLARGKENLLLAFRIVVLLRKRYLNKRCTHGGIGVAFTTCVGRAPLMADVGHLVFSAGTSMLRHRRGIAYSKAAKGRFLSTAQSAGATPASRPHGCALCHCVIHSGSMASVSAPMSATSGPSAAEATLTPSVSTGRRDQISCCTTGSSHSP